MRTRTKTYSLAFLIALVIIFAHDLFSVLWQNNVSLLSAFKHDLTPNEIYFEICVILSFIIFSEIISRAVVKKNQLLEDLRTEISIQKDSETKIINLSRIFAVISQINQTVIRTKDKDELFKKTCEIAVEFGKFKLAWVGIVDEEEKVIKPIAWHGFENNYLSTIKITAKEEPEGRGPTGTVIRTGEYYYCNDIDNDPVMLPWRNEALARGYRSSIALPIKQFEKVIGTLNLYASVPNFFIEQEIKLLVEVAGDISFALDLIEIEKEKQKTEKALQEGEEKYRLLFDSSLDGILLTSPDGFILSANPAACKMYGRPEGEIRTIGRNGVIDTTDPRLKAALEERERTGKFKGELTQVRKDGSKFETEISSSVFTDKEGNVRTSMIIRDISERKKSEEELRLNSQLLDNVSDSIFVLDSEGNIIYVNKIAYESRGYSKEELLTMNIRDINNPIFNHRVTGRFQEIIEKGYARFESGHKRKDGSVFPVEVNSILYELKDKKVILGSIRDITERKMAEEKLNLMKTSVEVSIDSAFWMDETGNIIYANESACKVLGYSMDELLTLRVEDVNPSASRERWNEVLDYLKRNQTISLETMHKRKDGSEFPVEISSAYVEYEGKVFINGFAKDITERKKAEEALRVSEQRYRDVIENATDIIFTTDINGNMLFANNACIKVTKYILEEFTQRNYLDLVLPEYRRKVQMFYMKQFTYKQQTSYIEFPIFDKNGEIVWLGQNANLILENNIIIGFHLLSRDITLRIKAQKELIESEERFRMLFEKSNVAIALSDINFKLYKVNVLFAQMMEYSEEELKNMSFKDVTHSDFIEKDIDNIQKLINNEIEVYRIEKKYITKSKKTIWGSLQLSVIRDFDGKFLYFLVNIIDITERKLAEEEIKKHVEELERFHRLTVGREMRIIELKKIVNELTAQLGKAPPYDLSFLDGSENLSDK